MAFPAELLRAGVAIANTLTKGVQGTISHEAYVSQDGKGRRTYAAAVSRECVIDFTRKQLRGTLITIVATVTFVGDVAIDPRDRITLPGGLTGPIIQDPNAVMDPATGRGFINTTMIGAV